MTAAGTLPPALLGLPQTLVVRKSRALLCFFPLEHHKHPHADCSKGTSHPALPKGRKADVRALLLDLLCYLPTRASKQKCPVSLRYRHRSDDNFEGYILGTKEYLPQPPWQRQRAFSTLMQVLPSAHCPQEHPRVKT